MSNILQRSFAGGEVSPEFFGRVDHVKYATGLALAQNFQIKPHGPAENRPGFEFVREVKDSSKAARLIPFVFNTDQTYVLEFGDQYVRFHTEGGTVLSGASPYEVATPYLEADLFGLKFVQSNDILTITHPSYAPRELQRSAATSWALSTITFGPTPEVLGDYLFTSFTGTAIKNTFDITGATQADPVVITVSRDHWFNPGDIIKIDGVGGMTELNGNTYRVGWAPATDTFTLQDPDTAADIDGTAYTLYTSGGTVQDYETHEYVATVVNNGEEGLPSAAVTLYNNLNHVGNYNELVCNPWIFTVSGTDYYAEWDRYNIYKRVGGVYGYIGQADGDPDIATFKDDNITPDLSQTPPVERTPFDSADNYPGVVSYYQQRRVFARTNNNPQTVWLTRTGSESDLSVSIPSRDDDAITYTLAAREFNEVRHVIPLEELLLLTAGGVWKTAPQNSDALTPTSVSAKQQGSVGAADIPPIVSEDVVLYVQASGNKVRDLMYNWDSNSYKGVDLTVVARHLFEGYTITDWTYAAEPDNTVWAVRSDGVLLGLTYVPDQQVYAWHRHTTDGEFESVCAVQEGTIDAVYAVVKRTVNGSTVRYVERLHSREFDEVRDAFFVDAGLTYEGTTGGIEGISQANPAVVTITGHGFSNGDEVEILNVAGMTDINGTRATVANTTADTFELSGVDASGYDAYTSGGVARELVTTISGLSHLEGATVAILADGNAEPEQTVTAGAITLDSAANKVHVGLPITADLTTMPLIFPADDAGRSRQLSVSEVAVQLYRTRGLFVGPSFDDLVEFKQRTGEAWGEATALFTGTTDPITIEPTWSDAGQLYIRQSYPLPITVLALIPKAFASD